MKIRGVCWMCGEPATKTLRANKNLDNVAPEDATSLVRHFCEECFEKHVTKVEKQRQEYKRLKYALMLETAIVSLEGQRINLYEYKDIIEQMQDYVVEHPEKFDSSEEIIAAIILAGHGVKSKPQYKVGNYKVDFLIPEFKVALEIDGDRHKYKLYRDNERDVKIRHMLGEEWEVVRIPIEHIDKNAKQLIPAILQLKADKQKTRREHGGVIPEHYSPRHMATIKNKRGFGNQYVVDE